MRVIFAGTPDFAATSLDALANAGFEIALVLTRADKPKGRGLKLQASAVKERALALGLPVLQPDSFKEEGVVEQLKQIKADVMVVVAYGLILPQEVLDIPRFGCLNIHASLLPRWRGAAPIQRAIESGDEKAGVGIMQMKAGLDTGDVLYELDTLIAADDNTVILHDRLAKLGAKAIVESLNNLSSLTPRKQDEASVTYAQKLTKQEAEVVWTEDAATIERKIRAFNPFPCAWTRINGENLKIWQASLVETNDNGAAGQILSVDNEGVLVGTGKGAILLKEVQIAGGKRLPIKIFLQGTPLQVGQMLGGDAK